MISFGVGSLIATPTVGSPVTFAIVQDVGIDASFAEKLLYGSLQFPMDSARGQGKITLKCKHANINVSAYNDLFFGGTKVIGSGTSTITMTNQPMGAAPFFSLAFSLSYRGKTLTVTFNRCTSNKLGLPFKADDHTIPELDISVLADDSGNIFTISGPAE